MWFDNGQWHPTLGGQPEDLGGPPPAADPVFALFPISSPPVAASPWPYRLTVFTRGRDQHLYGNQFNFGWSGWLDLGCCLATDVFFDSNGELQGDVLNSVAATSLANNSLDAFVIGTDHALYRKGYTSSAGWTLWQLVDASIHYDNIAVAGWVPIAAPPPAPPPPSPPPPPPTRQCGRAGQPPCIVDP